MLHSLHPEVCYTIFCIYTCYNKLSASLWSGFCFVKCAIMCINCQSRVACEICHNSEEFYHRDVKGGRFHPSVSIPKLHLTPSLTSESPNVPHTVLWLKRMSFSQMMEALVTQLFIVSPGPLPV